jgi:hypothetical protein
MSEDAYTLQDLSFEALADERILPLTLQEICDLYHLI